VLLKTTLHTLKCLGKHCITGPLLKQSLGQYLTCFPPIWRKGLAFFCFSEDSLLPVMYLLQFGLSSFPLALCLLGRPGFAALPLLLQVGLNTRKDLSCLCCPAYTELYRIVSAGSFLQLSDFVTGSRCTFPFLSLASRCFFLCFMVLGLRRKKINKTFK